MNPVRERVKDHFPSVLLTLLSIVQAIALGMLWSQMREAPGLAERTAEGLFFWGQVLVSLIGLLLIWLTYVNMVMRFRWVPGMLDTVWPFFIGILEFIMVESIGLRTIGVWFLTIAAISFVLVLSAHYSYVRARRDKDNAAFFDNHPPAGLRDYAVQIAATPALVAFGLWFLAMGDNLAIAFCALALTAGYFIASFVMAAHWWDKSVIDKADRHERGAAE